MDALTKNAQYVLSLVIFAYGVVYGCIWLASINPVYAIGAVTVVLALVVSVLAL